MFYSCLLYTSEVRGGIGLVGELAGNEAVRRLGGKLRGFRYRALHPLCAVGHNYLRAVGLEPVSYTHLDVYKRQVYRRMLPVYPSKQRRKLLISVVIQRMLKVKLIRCV